MRGHGWRAQVPTVLHSIASRCWCRLSSTGSRGIDSPVSWVVRSTLTSLDPSRCTRSACAPIPSCDPGFAPHGRVARTCSRVCFGSDNLNSECDSGIERSRGFPGIPLRARPGLRPRRDPSRLWSSPDVGVADSTDDKGGSRDFVDFGAQYWARTLSVNASPRESPRETHHSIPAGDLPCRAGFDPQGSNTWFHALHDTILHVRALPVAPPAPLSDPKLSVR
jgi:hypothetical protein